MINILRNGEEELYLFKLILTISLVLILAPTLQSAQALPEAEVPELSFDFGRVKGGAILNHDFAVYNRGLSALHIQSVAPS